MNLWALIPLAGLFTSLALLVLGLQHGRRRVDRIFTLFLLASGSWHFASFMLISNPYASTRHLIFWNQMVIVAIPWVAVSYYYFIKAYSRKTGGIGLYLGYSFVLAIFGLALAGYIVEDAYMIGGHLYHDIGPWRYIIGIITLSFLIPVMLMLLRRYRSSEDPADRNRSTYLIIGAGMAIIGGYVLAFTPTLARLPLDHIGPLANTLIIAYAIRRHHLLSISLVMRRMVAYSLVAISLVAIYAGIVFLGRALFPTSPEHNIVLTAVLIIFIVFLLAFLALRSIEDFVDRLFYRGTYGSRRTILNFSSKMRNIINLNQLADEMLPAINGALQITEARLLFQNVGSGDFITHFTYPNVEAEFGNEVRLDADSPIVAWLAREDTPLRSDQINSGSELQGMDQEEKEELAKAHVSLLCPIKSRGNLIGILALGKRRSGSFYSHETIQLLTNMVNQAGVIIENAQLYTQATIRATTDELTGLYNHSHFHERLEQEIARSSRSGTTFSLIMLDIDHFKAYNDTYGHLAGNQVLRIIGGYIKSSIRGLDMAFRYGGDEFTVILPEAQLEDAYRVAERIRKTIELETGLGEMPVTVSLGIANWPSDGVTHSEIIVCADAALYQAKRTGRNWTCLPTDTVKPETPLIGLETQVRWGALSIIYALAATVDAKDQYTDGHSKRVSEYAVAMAKDIGFPQDRIVTIRAAGLLHDIGKVGIPDSDLGKEGVLTEEESKSVKTHPELSVEILKHVGDLASCLPAILHHHERYDGKGYPSGLKGEDIPLEARILSVSDAFVEMTSPRPGCEPLLFQEVIDQLKYGAGTQFDPELVDIFCRIVMSPHSTSPGVMNLDLEHSAQQES